MSDTRVADFTQQVLEILIERPLIERLGLQSGDLDIAAMQGKNDLMAGRADAALARFARLVLVDPNNVDYQIGLGEAALANGAPELAMQCAAYVISARAASPAGYYLSGRAALMMGEPGLAQEDLNEAATRAAMIGERALQASAQQLAAMAAAKS